MVLLGKISEQIIIQRLPVLRLPPPESHRDKDNLCYPISLGIWTGMLESGHKHDTCMCGQHVFSRILCGMSLCKNAWKKIKIWSCSNLLIKISYSRRGRKKKKKITNILITILDPFSYVFYLTGMTRQSFKCSPKDNKSKDCQSIQIDASFWEYAEQYSVYIYLIFESQNRIFLLRIPRISVTTEVKVIREKPF